MIAKVAQYVVVIAAFFLPWLIGMMSSSVKNKNRRSLMVTAVLCSIDIVIITFAVVIAFAVAK